MRFVSMRTVPAAEFRWSDDLLAAFACELEGVNFTASRRLAADTPVADYAGKTVLAFTVEEMAPSSFFNGYCDVDRLNRDATEYFIKLTHEKYREHCGARLGTSIKGIFTDEPQFCKKETLGFRQFSLRGLGAVAGEWCLVCLAFNLKRLHVLAAN